MKKARHAFFFATLLAAAPQARAEPGRSPATWLRLSQPAPYAGILLDALDYGDLAHGVDDLEECVRARARDREEAASTLAAVRADGTIALAEARLRADHADARADGIEAAGRRAAEAAESAPSWWTVVGVGGLALAVGVVVGAVVAQ